MKKILLVLLLFVLIALTCTKRKESFIVGKWQDVPRIVNVKYKTIWTFKDGKDFSVERFSLENGSLLGRMEGEYKLYRKNAQFNLKLQVISGSIENYRVPGVYWVDKLNRDFLKIVREKYIPSASGNPFSRFEMIKI